jgi:hypothetical protein
MSPIVGGPGACRWVGWLAMRWAAHEAANRITATINQ